MTDKKYTWHRVAVSEPLPVLDNELREVFVGNKKICMAKREGKLYAFSHKCPHAGGRLSEGYIDNFGNIVCPVHRYKYNLKNGYNSSGEGYYLSTYPVEEREDGVYVGFIQTGGFWSIFSK